MKVFLISFLAILILGHKSSYAQKKKIDVYLIGGQSNATGQGYVKNLPKDFVIDTSVLLFHSGAPHLNSGSKPYSWIPLRQASESPDRFGPELGFGNQLKKLNPNKNIALIKHAHSGTNLYAQWNPGKNNTDSLNWGVQYKVFVKTVEAGLEELKKKGFKPRVKGMIWQQGENDADNLAESANYARNLSQFIKRVRNQFDSPKLKFIYGYVYPPPNKGEGRDNVRKAQFAVSQDAKTEWSVKNAWVVETDDLNHRADDLGSPYPKDHVHFGSDGILKLGVRMAEGMIK